MQCHAVQSSTVQHGSIGSLEYAMPMCSTQHAADNVQQATCSVQRAACSTQHTTQHTTQHSTAACSTQHTQHSTQSRSTAPHTSATQVRHARSDPEALAIACGKYSLWFDHSGNFQLAAESETSVKVRKRQVQAVQCARQRLALGTLCVRPVEPAAMLVGHSTTRLLHSKLRRACSMLWPTTVDHR